MRPAPDLSFSSYFQDQNESKHNIAEEDVLDAYYGRRVHASKAINKNGHIRRKLLTKNEDTYITIFVEPVLIDHVEVWDVIMARPSNKKEKRQARELRVGAFADDE